jgi:Bacterial SH3 domain
VASPSPVARPTNTAQATSSNTVYVGNTDGEGVFLRNTPKMDDKAQAYPDGTALTVIGEDVDGDGQHWKHVKTPDGQEGYVPSMYTTAAPP